MEPIFVNNWGEIRGGISVDEVLKGDGKLAGFTVSGKNQDGKEFCIDFFVHVGAKNITITCS